MNVSMPHGLLDLALTAADHLPTLGDLVEAMPVIPATTTCQELERLLARNPHVPCVLVHHPTSPEVVGIVQRRRFEARMSGPFGYGRALHSRDTIDELTTWDALTLRPTSGIIEAASRAITRPAELVDDDVVVQDGELVLGAVRLPTLLAALARALAGRALRDPLTGLANRDAFFGRVEEACRRSAILPGHATAVVYVDLDNFKTVNDQLGHDTGDAVLRQVAAALRAHTRPGDLVSRLGGDEFAVCLEHHTDPDGAANATTRLLAALEDLQLPGPAGTRVRASIGTAVTGGGFVPADELVRAADLAMYRAKRAGGAQATAPVVVDSAAGGDPLTGTSVVQAATEGQLHVHFQPIVRLTDRRVVSVEALVRWQHPHLGWLLPGAFLPAVERAGQLADLDTWVLRAATAQFSAWATQHDAADVHVNINLSVAGLLRPDVVDLVLDACRAARLDPTRLRIEVSEDLLAEHIAAVTPVLQALSAAGVSVVFDDVGAGSISLRHLRDVDADGLKIDRSYVAGALDNDRDRAVVQLLIDFGAGTGARVTAEGIETDEQCDLLLTLGCTHGQGWLFARPLPLADLSPDTTGAPIVSH